MEGFEFHVNGLDELQKALEHLKLSVARKILRTTLQEVANEFAELLFISAPRSAEVRNSPGWLASHFGVQLHLPAGDIAGAAFVGSVNVDYPRRGQRIRGRKHPVVGSTIGVADITRWLEEGTKGNLKQNAFMSRTWDAFENEALEHIISDLKEAIDDAVK